MIRYYLKIVLVNVIKCLKSFNTGLTPKILLIRGDWGKIRPKMAPIPTYGRKYFGRNSFDF